MALKLKENINNVKSSNELNFLGEGTYLEGTIETKGSLRIDGRVKGAIKTGDTVTIGANGVVAGEVYARQAVVGGRIEGNLKIEEKLVLEAKSTLIGNLKAKKLVIDEGAVFQGKSEMGATPESKQAEPSPYKLQTDFKAKTEDKGGEDQSKQKP
jgi:cytoskeletal protein CcmA (bactofilin family)